MEDYNYQRKYLKYKNKYLKLKNLENQMGGRFFDLLNNKVISEIKALGYEYLSTVDNGISTYIYKGKNPLPPTFNTYIYYQPSLGERQAIKGGFDMVGIIKHIEDAKKEFLNFKYKYYDPFLKLGYSYMQPKYESIIPNRKVNCLDNIGCTYETGYFYHSHNITLIKYPYTKKFPVESAFKNDIEDWVEKPYVSPGPGWYTDITASIVWDAENNIYVMRESWVKDFEDGRKARVYHPDFDSELHKLNELSKKLTK